MSILQTLKRSTGFIAHLANSSFISLISFVPFQFYQEQSSTIIGYKCVLFCTCRPQKFCHLLYVKEDGD